MQHRLSQIDTESKTAVCKKCGPVSIVVENSRSNGFRCRNKSRERRIRKQQPYRIHLGLKCERCLFEPENVCQLDVDHIDSNHFNNDVGNLQTLCANCHRLKTCRPDLY